MLKQLLKAAPPPSAALSAKRGDAEALREMARLDLRFFQSSFQNDGCTAYTLSFWNLIVALVGLQKKKKKKTWWFIYAVLENSLFTCPYLQSLGQQESRRPGEGKLSSAPSFITRLSDSP